MTAETDGNVRRATVHVVHFCPTVECVRVCMRVRAKNESGNEIEIDK